ncbi:MAG: TonB family protein [Bacteroidetes bacterium]|nr:TonB family protein [Bacteroidota bacterium]MBX7129972.1 energy transducer TonB [Flavobacteriales bacterium]MCC6654322.1 TonB family protein [Flavobacteriales bacterium]HNM68457.1 energy transducer TonB [Flavobacteriales bacterium]HNO06125.1 energy transducer TonB [Flavobacteriales bacterium]
MAQSFAAPEPFGGAQAVKWLIEQEFVMAPEEVAMGTEGAVELAFTVQADGTPKNMRVSRTLGEANDKEALRVASLIRWFPASVGGSALDKEHTLLVPISAKRYKKAHAKDGPPPAFVALPADDSGMLYPDKGLDSLAAPLIAKGLRGLQAYLAENLRYPEDARRRDIQGKVGVEFTVETSGHTANVRTLDALGAGCDEEAMRLIRSIKWRPAIKDGKRVRSILKLDIVFRLDTNRRP